MSLVTLRSGLVVSTDGLVILPRYYISTATELNVSPGESQTNMGFLALVQSKTTISVDHVLASAQADDVLATYEDLGVPEEELPSVVLAGPKVDIHVLHSNGTELRALPAFRSLDAEARGSVGGITKRIGKRLSAIDALRAGDSLVDDSRFSDLIEENVPPSEELLFKRVDTLTKRLRKRLVDMGVLPKAVRQTFYDISTMKAAMAKYMPPNDVEAVAYALLGISPFHESYYDNVPISAVDTPNTGTVEPTKQAEDQAAA